MERDYKEKKEKGGIFNMTCDKVNAKVEVQSDGSWKILEILGRHEQAYERKKFTNNRREICLKNKRSPQ